MKTIFTILLIILCSNFIQAQSYLLKKADLTDSSYIDKYQVFLEKDAELILISRFESIERNSQRIYVKKTYNPDKNVMTSYTEFKDYVKGIRNGKELKFYDNGNLWSEGQNVESIRTGEWKYYHYPNGQLKSYGIYKLNQYEGVWHTLDTLGRVRKITTYQKGMLDGEMSSFDENGEMIYKKNYYRSKAMDSTIYNQEKYDNLNLFNKQDPRLEACIGLKGRKLKKCTKRTIPEYVRNEILKSKIIDKVKVIDKVYLTYCVTAEGYIDELTFQRGICDDVEAVCKKMMSNFPKHLPGMRDGKPVKVYYRLPINISSN